MAKSNWDGILRYGMRRSRCESWSTKILMQIRPAYAYEGRRDLVGDQPCRNLKTYSKELRTHPDLSWAALLLIHILNSNIFFAIVSCGSHVVGVQVPELVLEGVNLSRSRLMTVLTKALSMADMPFIRPRDVVRAESVRDAVNLAAPQ